MEVFAGVKERMDSANFERSMTDPFYVVMLIEKLGGNFIVWDKSSCIWPKKVKWNGIGK